MNERIKELVKQAGGIACDDDNNELTPALVGKELQKFAELIVRECAHITWLNSTEDNTAHTKIKEHFGVE
jgi:hypothetical protein